MNECEHRGDTLIFYDFDVSVWIKYYIILFSIGQTMTIRKKAKNAWHDFFVVMWTNSINTC